MDQRISLVTFGVEDLSRARTFYEAMGWDTGLEPDDEILVSRHSGDRDSGRPAGGYPRSGGLPAVAYNKSPGQARVVVEIPSLE